MNQEQRLEFCKVCTKQRFKYSQGIICSLTDSPADFPDNCIDFEVDNELKARLFRTVDTHQNIEVSKTIRFVNYIIDSVFCTILSILIFVLIGLILRFYSNSFEISMGGDNDYFGLFIYIFSMLIYYFGFESLTGRSIGKYFTNTKVVDYDGMKPNSKVIFKRTISRLIPLEQFSFFGTENSGLHDNLSKTRVVKNK
ncbi:MAG: RDD family protein [Paludibacter sp.]|jgi:uncharacterized RDD family membrane protein YckC